MLILSIHKPQQMAPNRKRQMKFGIPSKSNPPAWDEISELVWEGPKNIELDEKETPNFLCHAVVDKEVVHDSPPFNSY